MQKAWAWAKTNQKIRVNPIHGEEEIYILVAETWAMTDLDREETEQSGTINVQDCVH